MKLKRTPKSSDPPQPPAALAVSALGPWRDRQDLGAALREHAPRLLLGGCEMFDLDSRFRHDVSSGATPRGFLVTCHDWQPSAASAREMQRATTALVRAGATEISVHNSGLTHAAAEWRKLGDSGALADLYSAYVRFVASPEIYASCGMHAFGLPDVEIAPRIDLADASNAIAAFNLYVLERRPLLATGHWFTWKDGGPRFRLRRAESRRFAPGLPLHNPFGVWQFHAH